ncbi:zinc finger and SCAN domain-containing protein 26 [Triplophysa rosa]|uniref:C2H2-type domain-containing protein n=1 Tax=Triplophysa rosa TaxID=992332 RepID=A0A9W8C9J6_TRIRA|nr:zinc finger and SCAN domain-containing protein 26 [Triplophysa rosa]XP_057187116.1 zinc finger and SCAN domain-containing protein 26 [Triplophysa rosa]KAI7811394.1 hypothetical protein IRJ41_014057 [Triplophysa rosa]
MEVEDALSAKFRTLIEGLMVATTAEIVKMFSKFLTETRAEISRSWKEIDSLKQQLEECELQKTEAIIRAQMWSELKRENDEVEVSRMVSQPDIQDADAFRPQAQGSEERTEMVSVENRRISEGYANTSGPVTAQSSNTGASSAEIEYSCVANSPPHSQETHGTQTVVDPELVCPSTNTLQVKGEIASSSKPEYNTVLNRPSSTGVLKVNPKSRAIKPVEKRRRLMKKHANDMVNVARALRDRQHLSMHRRCLCCTSDACYLQSSPARAHHQVPTVYVCRKCEKRFKTHILFKSHKCAMPQSCDRCGHTFVTMQGLSAHGQEVGPPFICSQCDQTFATQCAWNLHKRIHPNDTSAQDSKENVVDVVNAHKNMKSQLQVRLERISDSQLEAALCTKSDSLHDNSTSCARKTSRTQESEPGVAGTLLDSSVEESADRSVDAVMSTSTCQTELSEDALGLQSPVAHGSNKVKDEGRSNSGSDESGLCSSPRKRKLSDCSHDAYNGVFPVEKILKWRNNKGKSEVRVKWMPCSLCGAKFQNTWEPAESFPDLLED